jgi:hypothetical protein
LDLLKILSLGVIISWVWKISKKCWIGAWLLLLGSHLYPEFSLMHLPAHNSNHNLISLNTNSTSCFLSRPFRFEEFWTKDLSCGHVIAATWKTFVPIHQDLCLPKKLENTKVASLKWNSLHFGNIHKQINETLKLLDITQKTPPSQTSFELEISLKVDLDILLVKEESL